MAIREGVVRLLEVFFSVVGVAGAMFFLLTVGPAVESRWFPVIDQFKIERTVFQIDSVMIWPSFRKNRQCEYLGISWYQGERDTSFERVAIITARSPSEAVTPNRPVGVQHAGPWTIKIPAEYLRGKSFAEIYHRCWPFWISTSRIYP